MTENKVPPYDEIFHDLSRSEYSERFLAPSTKKHLIRSPSSNRYFFKQRFNASNIANYSHFIWTLIKNLNPKNSLLVTALPRPLIDSIPFIFEENYEKHKLSNLEESLKPQKKEYDFIYAEFPMGKNSKILNSRMKNELGFVVNAEWFSIFNCAKYLSKNGCVIAPVMPALLFTYESNKFLQLLLGHNLHINAIFEIPAIYAPAVNLRPYLISIKCSPSPEYFIGNAENVDAHQDLVRNLLTENNSDTLFGGTYVQKENFISFSKYRVDLELDIFKKKFSDFDHVAVGDIALCINQVKPDDQFKAKENAVYFPIRGSSDVISRLENCTERHQNYFQIELPKRVLADYFCYIFKSKLGQVIRDTLKVGMLIERVPKQLLQAAEIPLPSLEAQEEALDTYKKVQSLQQRLASIENELSANPLDHRSLSDQIDQLLIALDLESGADRISRIVRSGESKTLEFKQTFSLDVQKQTKKKYIEQSCLKTIVGFLNTDGGELLIGVHDDGTLIGMKLELKKFYSNSQDKFLLHFKDKIKSHIGEHCYLFLNYQFIKIGTERHVLSVRCQPSTQACYLDGKDFFIRANPSTDKLEGPQLIEYVKSRFG